MKYQELAEWAMKSSLSDGDDDSGEDTNDDSEDEGGGDTDSGEDTDDDSEDGDGVEEALESPCLPNAAGTSRAPDPR